MRLRLGTPLKIVMFGGSPSGKTCLFHRWIDRDFSDSSPSTMGAYSAEFHRMVDGL
jgi:GTPase SAR1 family protein